MALIAQACVHIRASAQHARARGTPYRMHIMYYTYAYDMHTCTMSCTPARQHDPEGRVDDRKRRQGIEEWHTMATNPNGSSHIDGITIIEAVFICS